MAAVTWTLPITPDAPTWSVTLTGLAIGAYSLSSVIDNTTGLLENAVFDIAMSTVTCAAGAPFVGLTLLYAPDGTNYPANPVNTAAATGVPQTTAIAAIGSAAFLRAPSPRFEVLPMKFKILLFNGLGVAFGTVSATNLYRFGETIA